MTKSRTKKKISMYLVVSLLVLTAVMIGVLSFNLVNIFMGKTSNGSTVVIDSNSSLKNDQYTIGNNPTDVTIEYFSDLTSSLSEGAAQDIATNVVKCFITEYFTWTNKDGNYEVGGVQYLYGPQYVMYEVESRWSFYRDLDLYINQYGRDDLLEVESVRITGAMFGGHFKIGGETYESYYIEARWTYKDSKSLNVDEFQQVGYFTVINNNGRYEIAQFFDSYE